MKNSDPSFESLKYKQKKSGISLNEIPLFLLGTKLLELALSCSLSLLLTLYAGLLVMLSLAKLGKNTGLYALSLEATKRVVESLILFNSDFSHLYFPPLGVRKRLNLIIT